MPAPAPPYGRGRAVRLVVLAAACSLVAGGLAVAASLQASRERGPGAVAKAYFLALARGDAPGALAFAATPPTPAEAPLLTKQVLRQQLSVAPIGAVRLGDARRTGGTAMVAVDYELRYGSGAQHRTDEAALIKAGSTWRLERVSSAVRIDPSAAGLARLAFVGRPVPTGSVDVFPGALPLSVDTPSVELAEDTSVRLADRNTLVTPVLEVTAAARRELTSAAQDAVTRCLSPTSTDPLCPSVTEGRPVPGSLHGSLTVPMSAADPSIALSAADPGELTLSAVIEVKGSWKAWDFNNQERTQKALTKLTVKVVAAVDNPGKVYWTAPAAKTALLQPAAALSTPGPPEAPEWWFDSWKVGELWAAHADGRGIIVAILDTGVQASIPELSGKVLSGADFVGNGTDGRVDFDSSEFSHGTAMASLIVAREGFANVQGLAPGARILPIALPLRGVVRGGSVAPPNTTATAVRYAVDHGAKIINMSLGGVVYEGEEASPCPAALQSAIVYAVAKGSLVVAASGNSADTGSPVEEPGVCLGVVSVGAVDSRSVVGAFSSRHVYLTVSAPGLQIPTLTKIAGSAFVGDGTSQATAIASGALAIIWSKYPTESSRQILARLLGTVHDQGANGRDSAYGLGVIDPYAAINSAKPTTQPNVVFDGVQPLLALSAATPQRPASKGAAGDPAAPIGAVEVGGLPGATRSGVVTLGVLSALLALLALAFWVAAFRRWVSGRGQPDSVH